MYSHVDHRRNKTFLKQIFSVFLIFTFYFNTISAYAGAAEKWEYDVIPDQSQILKIKGHKVDQYGAAVNDYDYNTKIDPKTAANRTKAGTVGFGRLLKSTGWGLLGAAALEGLLKSVDWILDPEAQSIWRYKKNPYDSSCTAFYCDLDLVINVDNSKNNPFYSIEAAEAEVERVTGRKKSDYDFRWQGIYSSAGTLIRLDLSIYNKGTNSSLGKYASATPEVKPEKEKEYLTPEELADYANHTHKDYSDPRLAPKLAPKYSPEIQTDLWKPSNSWEDANSPTVQEVKKELEKAPPEPKKEPEIKPNPETGGFALPAFCSWASPVCEFINWIKDNPENENEEPEIPKEIDIGQLDTGTFKATAGCPAPIQVPVNLGAGGNVEISYEPICQFASKWSFVAPLIGFLSGAMIIVGVGRKGEDGEI